MQPGDDIIVADHAFVVYKLMATLFGANTIEVPDPGFVHDLEAMAAAVTPKTKQLFIANPNNPTGTLVEMDAIERLLDNIPDHVVVIIDEAYYEFLDTPPDTLKFVREGRNVVVLRTFSKIQGLAALRIGYGLAPAHIAEVLQKDPPAVQRQRDRAGGGAGRIARIKNTRTGPRPSRMKGASSYRTASLRWGWNTSRATPTLCWLKSVTEMPCSTI